MRPGKKLISASAWLMVATGIMNLSMVLYHREMSARLGVDYAQLSVVIGLLNVAGVLISGVGIYLTKVFARDASMAGDLGVASRLLQLAPKIFLFALVMTLVLAGLSHWLIAYLHLPSFLLYGLMVLMALSALLLSVCRSAFQGLHAFWLLGASLIIEGFCRVAGGVFLVKQGMGVLGAIGGSLLASFIALVGSAAFLPRVGQRPVALPESESGKTLRHHLVELGRDTTLLGLFSLLSFLDIFIFKHFHTEEQAALYSRAALVAKSFLYAIAAFNLVILPAVASAKTQGRDPRPLFLRFLLAAFLIQLFGLAFVWSFTDFTIRLICGNKPEFLFLAPLIRWFCVAVVPLGLYQLVLYYQIAINQRGALHWMVAIAAAYLVLLEFYHQDMRQVISILGVVSGIAAFAALCMVLLKKSDPVTGAGAIATPLPR